MKATAKLGVERPAHLAGADVVGPQPGPQTLFLSTPADIAIFGGGRGGGKTTAILLEPARHLEVFGFNAAIFRRTRPQITGPDGLWDESRKLYPRLQGMSRETQLDWRFPAGSSIRFAHLEHEKDLENWLGSQICLLGFDQLEAFTEHEFFTLLACNRSTCGVRPYIRATCNPDPDSWLATFISWWIDQAEKLPDGKPNPNFGYPIEERSGRLRWFFRSGDEKLWFDSEEEALAEIELRGLDPKENPPLSVTFIRSLVDDNPALLEVNPQYVGLLNALPLVERERFRKGNWKIRPTAGTIFQRAWFPIVAVAPSKVTQRIRYWDRAATEPSPRNPDPDSSSGARVARLEDGRFLIEHVDNFQATTGKVGDRIKALGFQEKVLKPPAKVGLEKDPAAAGVAEIHYLSQKLAGLEIEVYPATGSKVTRAMPTSGLAEHGNVLMLEGPWNDRALSQLEAFDGKDGHKDDDVDSICGGVNALVAETGGICDEGAAGAWGT